MDNQAEEFGIETIAYQELESEFQEVLASLSSDQTLDRFRIEYERIHRALRHSHEQEKKLLGRCRDLSKDIIAGAAKLQSALKFSNDDSHTISYLKAEVAKTYKYLQLSREHEELSKQKIERLKAEMKKLHMLMEQNDSITQGQVASVHQYTIANEELEKQKEILQISLDSNKGELQEIRNRINAIDAQKENLKNTFQALTKKKQQQEIKVKGEEEEKKNKKDELEVIKTQFDKAKSEQGLSKDTRKALNTRFKELTAQAYDLEIQTEKERKLLKRLEKEEEVEEKKIAEIEELNSKLNMQMRIKEKDLHSIRQQLERERLKHDGQTREIEILKDKIQDMYNRKLEEESLRDRINEALAQLESELNSEKKSEGKDKSFIEKLKRDRDMYKKQLERAEASNKKVLQEIINKEKLVKEKENELFGQKKEIEKLNKQIIVLEKERDANSFQATSAEAKYFYSRDEVKLRDNFIAEFQKQNIETEAKLKKQQSLYEAVRSDRNLVSKKLAEVEEQKEEYTNRYKRVTHQITQLKEEIDAKEAELVKEHTEHNKKDKKIEDEEKKIQKFKKDIVEKEEKIKNFFVEKNKLEAIIKEIEYEKQKLQEEYELVVSERDILGTQLIRRSAQADLLYEKIKINESALKKGEAQYHEKILEMQTKKEEIASLMNEIKAYKHQNNAIGDLKAEIHNLTRELTDSRLKVKALSEEIEKPMNIHRWRKLEATDSSTYDLMTKIQSIQKRLIAKTEQVKKKEAELQLKEKELKSLQEVLKRQPSVEEEKMIPVYEQTLQQKQKQIQSMKEEIENYEQVILEYKIEYERLQKELQTFKLKFFNQKKREQQNKEDKKSKEDYIKVILPDKRFTGGGFNLAI